MIKFLLHFYPTTWRREYGGELAELLSARPLTLRAITNVLTSAMGQRLRNTPPWLSSALFQFLFFVTCLLLQVCGLLSPAVVARLIIPIAILLQFATGVWIAERRNGSFLSAIAGTIASTLFAYSPLQVVTLLISPPRGFPDQALMRHMRLVNAERIFIYVMLGTAVIGAIGAICGTMIKRFRGRPA
jgi:hypothetical protein